MSRTRRNCREPGVTPPGNLGFATILLLYSGHLVLWCLQQAEAVKVAIVNLVGFHNEVYTALLWSFQQAGGNVTAFVDTLSTWDIEHVLTGWYVASLVPSFQPCICCTCSMCPMCSARCKPC